MGLKFSGRIGRGRLGAGIGAVLLASTAMTGVSLLRSTPAGAQSAETSYSIPGGSLNRVLAEFGRQSGLQIVYVPAIAAGKSSPGVSGAVSPAQAVARILQGTGLTYSFPDSRTVSIAAPSSGAASGAAPAGAIALDTIDVEGVPSSDPGRTEGTNSYTTTRSSFGKNQTLRELPQTVTVMTHQRLQDQRLLTVEDAMERTPGITVMQQSTNSAAFYSRGFQITNFQIDGNSPIYGSAGTDGLNVSGMDLAMFDRVEVMRGSDALYGTAGQPSGVINFVRKKPTKQLHANAAVSGGSWDNYRSDLDVGGAVTENGSVRARLVGSFEDRKYFYKYAKSRKHLLYGIVEADVTDSTMLTVGNSILRQNFDGYNLFGLPRYSNGADIGLPRNWPSAQLLPRWSRRSLAEEQHQTLRSPRSATGI